MKIILNILRIAAAVAIALMGIWSDDVYCMGLVFAIAPWPQSWKDEAERA